MSLRLGVLCAVLGDDDRILLSHRRDLNIWTLPGGRLDPGERFEAAAAREVEEETGIVPHIERALGLYYYGALRRLNVLYAGWPLRGELRRQTPESDENRYFATYALPEMPLPVIVRDALAGERPPPREIDMPEDEARRLRMALRWRWMRNFLNGTPEPRFPRFEVRAVGVIRDVAFRRILTLPDGRTRALPRVVCRGTRAPWHDLGRRLEACCGVRPVLSWVGLWQDVRKRVLELIFAGVVPEAPQAGAPEWIDARNAPLPDLDMAYAGRVTPGYERHSVWSPAAAV